MAEQKIRRRNVTLLGREERHKRTIRLMRSGQDVKIDPSEWRQVANHKTFDDTGYTAILRVFRHRDESRFLVYGMRAVDGVKQNELNELVPMRELVPETVRTLAATCGVGDLADTVLEQLQALA